MPNESDRSPTPTRDEVKARLRAQALCGNALALDLLLAFHDVDTTERVSAMFMRELKAGVERNFGVGAQLAVVR